MDYKKIRTFEEACRALKIKSALPDFSKMPAIHQKALTAHYKLVIICQAINNGWQPNWNNSNEYKYYPWFQIKADDKRPAGFGFSHSDYDCWCTDSDVGSRLCYVSREAALYASKKFVKLYKEYFLFLK